MNIFIRVDASNHIGSGHVMRCITLAIRLQQQGAKIHFICREHVGHLCDLLEKKGFSVSKLPAPKNEVPLPTSTSHSHWLGVPWYIDAKQTKAILQKFAVDLLIIDHYAIDYEWEQNVRNTVNRMMVIDDLADREHDCDILIDSTVIEDSHSYHSLVPSHCDCFLGPSYALLRPEFYQQANQMNIRTGPVKRLLIFFGGYDNTNETGKALASFLALERNEIEADIVVGQSNIHKHKIKSICEQYPNLHFHCQTNDMALLMRKADISIGAGGTTTWERCFLGLPTLVLCIADNQKIICENLGKKQIIQYLGESHKVGRESFIQALEKFIENEQDRTNMSRREVELMKDNSAHIQTMIDHILKRRDAN